MKYVKIPDPSKYGIDGHSIKNLQDHIAASLIKKGQGEKATKKQYEEYKLALSEKKEADPKLFASFTPKVEDVENKEEANDGEEKEYRAIEELDLETLKDIKQDLKVGDIAEVDGNGIFVVNDGKLNLKEEEGDDDQATS